MPKINDTQAATSAATSWDAIVSSQERPARTQVTMPVSFAGIQMTLDSATIEREWEDDGAGHRRPTGPVVTDDQGRADVTIMVTAQQGTASVPLRLRHRWMTVPEWQAISGMVGVPGGVIIEDPAIAPYAIPPRGTQRSTTYGYTLQGRIIPAQTV